MKEKSKFALYLDQETREDVAYYYHADGSHSQTEFVERGLKFYLDYIRSSGMGELLPTEIKAYMDGRLGTFENRMASLLFKLSVEQNSMMRLLADRLELSPEEVRAIRGTSVQDVKCTNGRLTFAELSEELEVERWQN